MRSKHGNEIALALPVLILVSGPFSPCVYVDMSLFLFVVKLSCHTIIGKNILNVPRCTKSKAV